MPAFYRDLVADGGSVIALLLRMLVLTGVRSAEARGMMTDEIDGNVWSIPPHRTKSKRLHRVALSAEALAVIDAAAPLARGCGLVFPSRRGGKGAVSDTALSRFMRDHGMTARPHGLRSSFRVWAAETGVPREVAEAALGHVTGASETERAYQRSDYLERRQVVMSKWADFVCGRGGGEVVALPLQRPGG